MTTLLNGLLGGLLVGLVAGLVTQLFAPGPAATTRLLSGVLGSRVGVSRWKAGAIQVLYGGVAGIGLLVLELYVLRLLGVPPTVVEAFVVAVAWSALLFGTLALVG